MKYKVGDKVRIIDASSEDKGKVGFIKEIDERYAYPYDIRLENGESCVDLHSENELIPFNYTWEDFKKCPIGTKITFENRDIFVKSAEDCFDNGIVNHTYSEMKDIDEDEDIEYDYKKIIKIEEPTYVTVYELNEIEEINNYDLTFKKYINLINDMCNYIHETKPEFFRSPQDVLTHFTKEL